MNKTLKFLFGGIILLVALLAAFFIITRSQKLSENFPKSEDIKKNKGSDDFIDRSFSDEYPECPKDLAGLFSTPIMPLEAISALIPLGNLGPPGHTFPVDHTYFHTNKVDAPSPLVPVYAPGDIWLTDLAFETRTTSDGKADTTYTTVYSVCKGISFDIGGYSDLTDEMKAVMSSTEEKCKDYEKTQNSSYEVTVFKVHSCTYPVNLKLPAGTQIGWSGGGENTGSLEIFAYNFNLVPDPNVNWERYGYAHYPYAFCFFDLYSGELHQQFDKKFGFYEMTAGVIDPVTLEKTIQTVNRFIPRVGEPLCGTVHQNIPGTAQGDWFGDTTPGDASYLADYAGLALVHDNLDSSLEVISAGGFFNPYNRSAFQPRHEGLINRDFAEVAANGSIYCYHDFLNTYKGFKVLIQLVSEHEIKVERLNGECSELEAFTSPVTLTR